MERESSALPRIETKFPLGTLTFQITEELKPWVLGFPIERLKKRLEVIILEKAPVLTSAVSLVLRKEKGTQRRKEDE